MIFVEGRNPALLNVVQCNITKRPIIFYRQNLYRLIGNFEQTGYAYRSISQVLLLSCYVNIKLKQFFDSTLSSAQDSSFD